MSKADIIRLAKAVKKRIRPKAVCHLSYCRRIERVKTDKRICAMTFDDGPTYDSDITSTLLDVLEEFGAKGTFDVIGTTENNYPDTEGKIGTPGWSGTKYDHYPRFGEDKRAGAVNCPDLIERIIKGGHEITNHTYSHVLYGKKNVIYSKRNTLNGFDQVYEDVEKLHSLLMDNHGYEMKFSRPPHYVDKIKGGFTSYDIYAKMGYNYLAASFDGAGWLPCESDEAEINAMTEPLISALENDADALCGQIIFQKDGYNMSLRAPVKEGLKRQLEILKKYGYTVVTVSELFEESPFKDVGREDSDYETFCKLAKEHCIVYSDNTLQPDRIMTKGELAVLLAPRSVTVEGRIEAIKTNKALPCSVKAVHPYSTAICYAMEKGYITSASGNVTAEDIKKCSEYFRNTPKSFTRRDIYREYRHN